VAAAAQMMLTGEQISAERALRLGLVNEVVAPEKLMERGLELAGLLAAQAPVAVRHLLAAIYEGADLSLQDGLLREAELFSLCCQTEDKMEGTRAFLEKRAPSWLGR
jgi:enoyl-CoA hydratase